MDFKIIKHTYENTGGGCMVGFDEVWLPEEHRTIFVRTNEMGCSFWECDAYSAELDDIEPFDDISTEDEYGYQHKYFDLARECMRRFLFDDGINYLPFAWLPDIVQKHVTVDYKDWLIHTQGFVEHVYETDGKRLYLDNEYMAMLDEQKEKERAAELVAVQSELERAEIMTAFENFKCSYMELVKVWDKNRLKINSILVTEYPFDQSFDELEVVQWCNDIIYEIAKEAVQTGG